ncbi:hypothetical protein JNN96_36975 [Mycobacterium sp. DSM 3803]|nr:hypothetical protein [Mycobacterium sp. DSM 3803]
MSIEIPGWLRWVGDLIGEDFPEGDEDKVWQQAERWKHFANLLEAQKSAIDTATRNTLDGFASGDAHDAMKTEFQTLVTGDGSIDVLIKQLRDLSDAVDKTGTEIEFAKEMYIANLAILAATLTALAASIWFNWGAPAEGAAAIAATEFTISQIIRAAIAKVIEAGASKIITQLALRALQGAAFNAITSAGLNAGIQGLQMWQGHRDEFDAKSLGLDTLGGGIAGAFAGPLVHGAKTIDLGSALNNRLKTFGTSVVANTGGMLAAQQALTGDMNFGDATMSGLIYGGIDGARPSAAAVPRVSAEPVALSSVSDRPGSFGGESGLPTAAQHSTSSDVGGSAGSDGAGTHASSDVDRPLNLGGQQQHSQPGAEQGTAPRSDTGTSAASSTTGPVPRSTEVSAPTQPGRADAPASTSSASSASSNTQAGGTPTTPRASLSSSSAAHPSVAAEPAARVAESSSARAGTPAAATHTTAANSTGEPPSSRHAAAEPSVPESNTSNGDGHKAVGGSNETSRPTDASAADPSPGAKPDDADHGPTPDGHKPNTSDGNNQTPSETMHPSDRWQDVARHEDDAHSRALAEDALSRRIPPVEPDALRAPHGSRDQALARAHDNADWWNGLTGEEQRALIDTYPRAIGNAEGIPAAARHEANSNTIAHDRDELRSRQESGERLTRSEQKYLNRLDKIDAALQDATRRAEQAGVGGPHILAFDPSAFRGEGRAIVAFGDDPYRAESVSWHVPGLTTTIDSLGTNMTNAFNHLQSTRSEHPGISASSIAWIGYDAPSGRNSWRVAFHGLARDGGNILHSDISGFNAARDLLAGDGSRFTNNHIFGHSYGSTTTSYAGEGGRLHDQVRTVTLLGSPGAGPHRSADGFGIGRDNVFVASSSRDWVTTLGGRESGGRFLGHFGLGRDPAMDTWGGRRITSEFPVHMDTAGTVGTHTAYYHYVEEPTGTHPGVRSESLANFGRIAAGHPERLDFERHRTEVDGPRWRPGLRTEEPAAGRPLRLDEGGSGREYPVDRRPFDPRWHPGQEGSGSSATHTLPRPPDDDGPSGSHRPLDRPVDGHRSPEPSGPRESHSEPQGQDRGATEPERHPVDTTSTDLDTGSPWDGPAGHHAAQLLPTDDSGYQVQPRDCEFLGITPEQVEVWANREAPLGMTPAEFREFNRSLYEALAREGINHGDVDVRLQGSSARFFSGEHKSLPSVSSTEIRDNPDALARMNDWFGDDANRPLRRPFDSMYRLGLDPEPSDYDIQISSDAMVDACRERWEASGSQGDMVNSKYGFIRKVIFGDMFPTLWEWAERWTAQTGRPVVPALFPTAGPPDTSAGGVSSHFRASDWRILPEEGEQ